MQDRGERVTGAGFTDKKVERAAPEVPHRGSNPHGENLSCSAPCSGARRARPWTVRAWEVVSPRPLADRPLRLVDRETSGGGAGPGPGGGLGVWRVPHRSPRRRGRPSGPPKKRRAGPRGGRDVSTRSVRTALDSPSVIGSASRGWPERADGVSSVGAATRTSASGRRSRVGTTTAGTRRQRWSTSATRTGYPTACLMTRRPRCCARGSSGIAPCAGRAFHRGGRLGIYGFGGSAHLTAQVALHEGAEVHVMTRSEDARRLALELGAASAGPADASPPVPLDAAILFAPAGEIVPVALGALDRGGVLVIAGIHLSDIPPLRLPGPSLQRARGPQRHGQHPTRRRGIPPNRHPYGRGGDDNSLPARGRRPGSRRPRR